MKNLLIILLIFLYACGYSPIYKNKNSDNLNIEIVQMKGDNGINQLIKNELRAYSKEGLERSFEININSELGKIIISKDSSGSVTNYQIFVKVRFEIMNNEKIENIYFEEKFNIKNISNTFEQRKYENTIKLNFAESIKDKLILKLLSL